jgi:4-hydroxybenzoate polyprenyltransferase
VLRKIFDFLLFSSLFISSCAVLMLYQTYDLLLHSAPSLNLSWFVFYSTVCSYNFHWYLTPESSSSSVRIAWAQKHKGWHLFLYFVGLLGSVIYFFTLKDHWFALAFIACVTFLYTAPKLPQPIFKKLKRIAIGKTIFLTFVWTYVTTVLPILLQGKSMTIEYGIFILSRYFLIYAICILFDYRDREDDKRDGIRSMITYFDERGINFIFYLSLVLFTICTLILTGVTYNAATAAMLILPGALAAGLYNYAKRNFSDYLYYFVLDGLMALSGLLLLLVKI